jgi:hypothetical protein
MPAAGCRAGWPIATARQDRRATYTTSPPTSLAQALDPDQPEPFHLASHDVTNRRYLNLGLGRLRRSRRRLLGFGGDTLSEDVFLL